APAPEARGAALLGPLDALYVSSTLAGDWLARVGAHGLGDRSRAVVTVHDAGLHVARTGAPDLWVPATAVRGAALTPGMAGKFVGKEAIVVVTWAVPVEPAPADPAPDLPPQEPAEPVRLDTGLMPRHDHDVARLLDAVRDLAGRRTTAPDGATDAPADPGGRPSHDPGPDAAPNDKEAQ
ncbi:PH-like domain-containing protein, partial [Cellulosimicrobium cellulans]|uniref:PH-like domain-containing protein n=1 Tax=Cellulosimicrobium cellulans TaxID=1710 RepID=UPI000848C2DF